MVVVARRIRVRDQKTLVYTHELHIHNVNIFSEYKIFRRIDQSAFIVRDAFQFGARCAGFSKYYS
jgi:hypothetical protein